MAYLCDSKLLHLAYISFFLFTETRGLGRLFWFIYSPADKISNADISDIPLHWTRHRLIHQYSFFSDTRPLHITLYSLDFHMDDVKQLWRIDTRPT